MPRKMHKRRFTHGAGTNHDDRALRVGGKPEGRASDMDRSLVVCFRLVRPSGTLDKISRERNASFAVSVKKGNGLAVRSVLEVEQEVGSNTEDKLMGDRVVGHILVLEDDSGSVDRVRVKLRAG